MNSRHINPRAIRMGGDRKFVAASRLHSATRSAMAILAGMFLAASTHLQADDGKLSLYTYEDTKRLVSFVEAAAALMEQEGEAAFARFEKSGSRWLNDKYYLFVYTPEGKNVFHPIEKALVGRDLIDLRDASGKPVAKLIADIATKPGRDASGWIFYLWEDKTQLIPLWKSSYIRKVSAPDGRIFLIGSGLYEMKIEKAWVEERVRLACEVLQARGKEAAFKEFLDPASPFVFLGTYVFVLDPKGRTVVDPSFPTMAGRDLSGFKDAVGMPVIQELQRKLAGQGDAWVQYLWPKPGSPLPARKLMYVRKVTVDGETFLVGSDFFLATPIWMRG